MLQIKIHMIIKVVQKSKQNSKTAMIFSQQKNKVIIKFLHLKTLKNKMKRNLHIYYRIMSQKVIKIT